ncbi:MAG: hypothetical protein J6589_01630 [Snodgrassella sp.]|uniref:hypothetical protein n=1 Tax=Snodgrassella sp. TaxID=2815304 RepID=UPI0025830CEA|nr:hypothetical protein [Snodgrassella sp.]MCO6513151.1 hypothetical protein [Snodgrassella sp.]
MVDNGREALRLPVLFVGLSTLPFVCRHPCLTALLRLYDQRERQLHEYLQGESLPSRTAI